MEIGFLVWDLVSKTTHYKLKTAVRFGIAAVVTLLMAFGVLQGGSRYAGIIALLTVMGIILLLSLRKKGEREISKTSRRVWRSVGSMVLYLNAMIVAILFPQIEEIAVTGNYPVQKALYTWQDESRVETFSDSGEKRSVTVQIYYPETAGRYPLAVYSHGAASTMDANDSTCRELASHGYVAAAVAHPYHAMFVTDVNGATTSVDSEFMQLSMSGPLTHTNEEMLVYYKEWTKTRTDDLNFVLDTILEYAAKNRDETFARIDVEHIGLFGHSMGGAACEALGRQRDDAREVTFRNAAHMNFCDLPVLSPPLAAMFGVGSRNPRECIETVNGIVLEYFDHYLKGDASLDILEEY